MELRVVGGGGVGLGGVVLVCLFGRWCRWWGSLMAVAAAPPIQPRPALPFSTRWRECQQRNACCQNKSRWSRPAAE